MIHDDATIMIRQVKVANYVAAIVDESSQVFLAGQSLKKTHIEQQHSIWKPKYIGVTLDSDESIKKFDSRFHCHVILTTKSRLFVFHTNRPINNPESQPVVHDMMSDANSWQSIGNMKPRSTSKFKTPTLVGDTVDDFMMAEGHVIFVCANQLYFHLSRHYKKIYESSILKPFLAIPTSNQSMLKEHAFIDWRPPNCHSCLFEMDFINLMP